MGIEVKPPVSAISRNSFLSVTGPAAVLVLLYLAMPRLTTELPVSIAELVPMAPYVAFAGAIGLGAIFDRSRVVLAALTMAAAYWVLTNQVPRAEDANMAHLIIAVVGMLLPLNLLGIAELEEKGLMTLSGFAGFAALLVQMVVFGTLVNEYPSAIYTFFGFDIVLDPRVQGYTPVPQMAVLAYFVAAVAFLRRLVQQGTVFASGFFGALVATGLALHTGPSNPETAIYFTVATLILIIAVAHNSYTLAYVDELTGLPGRRALNEELSRMRGRYTVAMLDVDHFKGFNDTYGHDIGDQVLRMVAAKIRRVGGGGKAFRYGGEEFAILFPHKTMKDAFPYLSNVRENIDAAHLILRGSDRPDKRPKNPTPPRGPVRQVHVTISIGFAEAVDDRLLPEDVIKQADQALYRAKEKGRNRISQ